MIFGKIFQKPSRYNTGFIKNLRFYSCKVDLGGIIPPLATNFQNDGSLDLQSQIRNLDLYKTIGFKGYVIFGTNGEHVMLSKDERITIMKLMREILPHELLIAGVKAESTQEAQSQARDMINSGANVLLVGSPTIFKSNLTDSDLIQFFQKVADSSTVPILTYNMPSAFGTELTADVIITLSQHPNIIGFKDSGGDVAKLSRIAYETKSSHFQVLAGGAGFLLPSMVGGCSGGICAMANVMGKQLVELFDLIKMNKLQEAVPLQARMIQPNLLITRKHGVAGLKYAMELFGYVGGPCRAPLAPLSSAAKDEIKNAFHRNGFL